MARNRGLFIDRPKRLVEAAERNDVNLAPVFSGNTAAINAYRKCGFKEIGRRTKRRFVENRRHDEIYMELLRDEPPEYAIDK